MGHSYFVLLSQSLPLYFKDLKEGESTLGGFIVKRQEFLWRADIDDLIYRVRNESGESTTVYIAGDKIFLLGDTSPEEGGVRRLLEAFLNEKIKP